MHAYRTHDCGALRAGDVGQTVRLSGWVHRKRDHGGVLFIDLRDHYGVTQLVVMPQSPAFAALDRLRAESVVRVDGRVVARSPETINVQLPTGQIEVRVDAAETLSEAQELPLPVFGEPDYPEEIRLKYRFLDLRRESLHKHIILRSRVIASLRQRMIAQGFTEFQTPILTASSPEGARDFLVPSRLHPGKFYALPQAPQQFKQLLMVAGFDRYFQIAPCFRDEDARADRSPGEFYQLDFEMSFVTQEDVFAAIEPVLAGVFDEFGQRPVTTSPFPRIKYADAIAMYGSDKPDLRNPLILQDVSEHFRGGGFGLFARILEGPKGAVWAVPAPGGGNRAFCDRMNAWAQSEGQPGLGYVFWREKQSNEDEMNALSDAFTTLSRLVQKRLSEGADSNELNRLLSAATAVDDELSYVDGTGTTILVRSGWKDIAAALESKDFDAADRLMKVHSIIIEAAGPIAKNIGPERAESLRQQLGLGVGDAAFFVAGDPDKFYKFAGLARNKVADELGLADKNQFKFCWIVDFPMYEWSEEEEKIDFSHNPFSMPNVDHDAFLKLDAKADKDAILAITAFQYDIVCNGVELSSGAIRNHKPEIMLKAFEIAGYPASVVEDKFGGMLNAFRFGAPPHGGSAPGVDRIVMLLAGVDTIRDVIAFPLNQQAQDLMMNAPNEVSPKHLRELSLRIVDTPQAKAG